MFDLIKTNLYLEDVKIKNNSATPINPKTIGFIEYDNNYQIFVDEKLYKIDLLSHKYDLDSYLKTKQYKAIVYIKELLNSFYLVDIYFFAYEKSLPKFNIGIDNKAFEELKKRNYGESLEDVLKNLKEKLTIKINGFNYYIASVYSDSNELDSFILFSDEFVVSIKKTKIDNEKISFTISKILSSPPKGSSTLILLKTDIEFKNALIEEKIANDLEDIINKNNSYIKTWDKYLDVEGDILLKKARDIGVIRVNKIKVHSDKIELICSNIPKQLSKNDSIGFFDKEPDYLKDDFTFAEFLALIEKNFESNKELFFQILDKKENSIFIENSINPKELEGKIIAFSLLGDKVQIRRKFQAREMVIKGESANPFLGLILEGGEKLKDYPKPKIANIEPLSDRIIKKIFPKEPTSNQIEAIKIAINTPDIAIIQGPPGTGKTTVIAAIIERLNELKDKNKLTGEILVTGYQHEAVINLTKRLKVNSLPVIKFGVKDDEELLDRYEYILSWAEEIVKKIKIDNFSKQNQIDMLERYIQSYLNMPTDDTALKILDNLDGFGFDEEVERIKSNITKKEVFDIKELRVIYGLRVNEKSFNDDVKERIEELLNSKFINVLDENEINCLEKKDIKYLNEYKKIKAKLIKTFYPKPEYQKPKPNVDVLNLIDKIKEILKTGKTKKDKINKILFDYRNTLKNNPFVLEEMIKDYSFVFGSTTQQSDRMELKKDIKDKFFDTVIIDEAARVPPMDLLIPMVKAKKRIILVGDHRQLPHMVNEEVISRIEKEEDIEESYIKKSIFEHLKEVAINLEKIDGIKRTITLNNQYRTNPIMGEFISKNFYEKYNEGFNSPRKMEEFSHNLKGIENKPCVWIDVKREICTEEGETSKSRDCEAEVIIKYLKEWINSNLSFGIITFYKRQAEKIKEMLKKELPEYYRKVKVGTVDAFQGMEFDVVFLSVVRSKENYSYKPNSDFGFLISKNRLCVSMSRQKKVLIVVGDKDYFSTDCAKKYLPEIYNYIELCKNKGIIL